jgi:hypothetical protein
MGSRTKMASGMAGRAATCSGVDVDVSGFPAVWTVGPDERPVYAVVRPDTTDMQSGRYAGDPTTGTAVHVPAQVAAGDASPVG